MNPENLTALSKSEKMLVAIYELYKKKGGNITVEDVAVQLWKTWPTEFCMRGYPQYPNVDIQKYITKILDYNLVTGGVYNYKITEKGKEFAESLTNVERKKESKKGLVTAEQPRYIRSEITRIINSKVFKYFISNDKTQLLESDFFEFIGTSARSLSTKDKNIFFTRYKIITNDIIPYCKDNQKSDEYLKKTITLWEILSKQFQYIIKKGV